MSDNVTIDEVIDKLILLDKIEKGLDDVNNGYVYTTDEIKTKVNKWLK